MPNGAIGVTAGMAPQSTEIVNIAAFNLRDCRDTFQMVTNHRPPTLSHIQVKQEQVDIDNKSPVDSSPPLSPPAQAGMSPVQGKILNFQRF